MDIPVENMSLIASRMKSRREELKMSYQDVADKTGLSRSSLQRYETGHIKNLKLNKIGILANALNTTPAYLMGWEEKEPAGNTDELDAENLELFKKLSPEKKKQALEFLRFLQGV